MAEPEPSAKRPEGAATTPDQESASAAAPAPAAAVAAARRVVESATIAIVTTTGFYLVGSVYTDAYYGRMSIEPTALDWSPPYLALQSTHVLPALLEYPGTLLVLYVLYRIFTRPSRWLRARYDGLRQRAERALLLITNLLIVSPLIFDTIYASSDRRTNEGSAVVSTVNALLVSVMVILVAYLIWLSVGPRVSIIRQIRQRQMLPIALLVAAYLLNALVATSEAGARAAERFMLGLADTSAEITFTPREGYTVPRSEELLLVTLRQGTYYVVERQLYPPALRPTAYMVPASTIEFAQVRRVNEADLEITPEDLISNDLLIDMLLDPAGTLSTPMVPILDGPTSTTPVTDNP